MLIFDLGKWELNKTSSLPSSNNIISKCLLSIKNIYCLHSSFLRWNIVPTAKNNTGSFQMALSSISSIQPIAYSQLFSNGNHGTGF